MWLDKWVVCCFVLVLAWAQEEVQLDVAQGKIRGELLNSVFRNKPYYSFKGIPYAKPNVGADRFRDPEPAGNWEGVLDATQHRSKCPFYCMMQQAMLGTEDCLYLNVYSPDVDGNARQAVMVFIHTGGYQGGFSDVDLFGPDYLVEEGVIVVTFNYRLGALGFLNTGDANAPGNAGMKDQVMALRWVRDNIRYFGGDPNRVTIFGHDSGAASVQYHMLSPMSEGLFKGAILQSGSALTPSFFTESPRDLAFKLGEALGVSTTDSAELVAKLKEFSPPEIIGASDVVGKSQNPLNGHLYAFVPSIEADLGQERFLPDHVWSLMLNGKIADVPVMAGVTANEAAFLVKMFGPDVASMVNNQIEAFVPDNLNITEPMQIKQLSDSMRKFYFDDKPLSSENQDMYENMLDDIFFVAGSSLSLDILDSRISGPIYEYLFTYDGPFGIIKALLKLDKGVVHGDDLRYLFYANAFRTPPSPGSPEEKLTRIFAKLWASFAQFDDPTATLDDDVKVKWEPRGKDKNYMNINVEPKMEKGLFSDRMAFWKNMYKDVLGKYA